MERLTNFQGILHECTGCTEQSNCYENDCGKIQEAIKKLADYENMEEDGKLLKLPCKPGDTVYTNLSVQGWYMRKDKRPYKARVTYIGLSENPEFNCFNVLYGDGKMWQFKFSDIGKTVFMTEDEAKEALEKVKA